MLPETQCKLTALAMNLIGRWHARFFLLSGSSPTKGGGLNFRCASVTSYGLIEALKC
jgi:hypothetical protein